jgi:peroxiredoxin
MTTPQTTSKLPSPGQGRPSPFLILFLVLPLIGIVFALLVAGDSLFGSRTPATPALSTLEPLVTPAASLINQPAPDFTLAALEGGEVRLSGLLGQVIFVNFWATWCEPCQRELPAFEAFTADPANRGQAVILAVNNAEPEATVREYLTANDITGLNIVMDAEFAAYDQYAVRAMPTTFVIDPAGVVRYVHYGELTLDDLNSYVAAFGAQPTG